MATDYSKTLSINAELTEDVSREIRRLGVLIDQAVVAATPFDTGRAKSNWLMGVYTPPTRQNYNDFDISGSYSLALAAEVAKEYPIDSLPDLWIVNNLPYIGRLNDGWSAQAGKKFVEQAIDQAVSYGR